MTAATDAAELVRLCDGDDDLAYDYLVSWQAGGFNHQQAGPAVVDWLLRHAATEHAVTTLLAHLV